MKSTAIVDIYCLLYVLITILQVQVDTSIVYEHIDLAVALYQILERVNTVF